MRNACDYKGYPNIFLIGQLQQKKTTQSFHARIFNHSFHFRGNQLYSFSAVNQGMDLERTFKK